MNIQDYYPSTIFNSFCGHVNKEYNKIDAVMKNLFSSCLCCPIGKAEEESGSVSSEGTFEKFSYSKLMTQGLLSLCQKISECLFGKDNTGTDSTGSFNSENDVIE